jgi:hypothetical protein
MPVDAPKAGETKEEYLEYCIPAEIKAGYEVAQATAICLSRYDRKELSSKKFSDPQRRVAAKLNFEKKYEGINLAPLEKGPNDPCWDTHVQVGTKTVDGREVPNCVPLND